MYMQIQGVLGGEGLSALTLQEEIIYFQNAMQPFYISKNYQPKILTEIYISVLC